MSLAAAQIAVAGRLLAGLLFGIAVLSSAAQAQSTKDVPINAFYGKWIGSGVSQTEESIAFAYTHRDLNVTINPVGNGFSVAWVTVQRQKGDPNKPTETRKATTMTFVPIGRPNVWRATGSLDPMGGSAYSWARLKGQTLTLHSFQVQPDGSYELQVYERTLTGLGMQLEYSRILDGETTRTVRGQLTKFAD
jgi:hypothetical protein